MQGTRGARRPDACVASHVFLTSRWRWWGWGEPASFVDEEAKLNDRSALGGVAWGAFPLPASPAPRQELLPTQRG